ncbi:hypothetical protein ACFOTA_15145 [Chitinophaga sp. GCM10012297]|uniref:Uncharacterized protein n=1 Tax=Chitinophaga chungangae TaxID=2821488 RepID=A0ABS3YFV2_9BACT|nr:hypothetical protein [Chitinophaga chungangae]MBO9153555.1 hypothetical protein [Chitinophaga chungangae]
MKKYISAVFTVVLAASLWMGCKKDSPVDEDGLLITTRAECFVASFDMLGSDHLVTNKAAVIDTTAQTINIEVKFGTDLKKIWPRFGLAQDCKLDPKITTWVDFSDLSTPREWTVISGNRQVRKTYKVFVTVGN